MQFTIVLCYLSNGHTVILRSNKINLDFSYRYSIITYKLNYGEVKMNNKIKELAEQARRIGEYVKNER